MSNKLAVKRMPNKENELAIYYGEQMLPCQCELEISSDVNEFTTVTVTFVVDNKNVVIDLPNES